MERLKTTMLHMHTYFQSHILFTYSTDFQKFCKINPPRYVFQLPTNLFDMGTYFYGCWNSAPVSITKITRVNCSSSELDESQLRNVPIIQCSLLYRLLNSVCELAPPARYLLDLHYHGTNVCYASTSRATAIKRDDLKAVQRRRRKIREQVRNTSLITYAAS